MKRLSLLTMLLVLMIGSARAATVSGTATNSTTSVPINNQKIYIFDSLGYYFDSTFTNTSGSYSFTLPSVIAPGNQLNVYTRACGAIVSHYYYYSGSSITSNFSICSPAPSYMLHGTVSLGGIPNHGFAEVYLIRSIWDTLAGARILTAIDSTITDSSGLYSLSYFSMPTDTLLLKAALLSSHPNYASYLPTYYSSSIVWSGANMLTASNFSPANATNINMIGGTNTGGPGFIGGSVLVGANKSTAVGDPLSHRILLLTTAANVPVAYTYSDATGHFSFTGIPVGTYKIFGDVWGKSNPALTVTISTTSTSVSTIVFEENDSKFEGHLNGLIVGGPGALTGVSVFPNPVTDNVQLKGLSSIHGSKIVVLTDITGAVIEKQTIADGQSARLSTATLPAGMYLLQLSTEAGNATYKISK